MATSTDYHEPYDVIPAQVRETHRAIVSLVEEMEAVDWYNQRAAVTSDESLARILEHNRDEEIEHAVMVLEWLRRRIPKLDENLRTYLFTQDDITGLESNAEAGSALPSADAPSKGLGIGNLHSTDDERTE